MQAPTIVFDHVNKTTKVIRGGARASGELALLAAKQQGQVTTASPAPKR